MSSPFPSPTAPARLAGPRPAGMLDGQAILRFAHAFESGGGTERYLDDLDHALLTRNAVTIVRLHLTRRTPCAAPSAQSIGRGRLVRVPLPVLPERASTNGTSGPVRLKQQLRDWVLYQPLVWRVAGARWTAALRLAPRPGEAIGAGAAAASALHAYRPSLAMLHFCGGADAEEVIAAARNAGTPVAFLNHYSNRRFLNLAIRKHTMLADAVAGVSSPHLPSHVRAQFTNLADGIDVAFFQRANARPLFASPRYPLILLPARVVREKGQLDLVRAVAALHASGVRCSVAFAGRTDGSAFVDELKGTIAQLDLMEHVHFLGAVSVEELRDWYAAAAVVALPTRHDEGLPRIVLESLAMGTPVVAYATGGVADGIEQGKTGFLTKTGDLATLTTRLREILTSAALRSAMAERGRKVAESQFSLTALAERHEQFYRRVINAAAQRQPARAA